ncbi:MAG: hypothetical protein IPM74_10555 [Crocinitomicaceae bacterium]|nr:hypothetical protein [Crocinitomicaceae bacterium]MBK8926329.1 hypothetical protein [Crocinitomicaceae bacterium]
MKSTKTCPKCQSTEIFTNMGITKRGERSVIPVTGWSRIHVDVFVCTQCGYFEEYLDMKDKSGIEKLKVQWNKT